MPRFKGGIGRTGKKHINVANFDIHRQINTELVKESSCSVHEAATTNEAELEEAAAVLASATIDDIDDEQMRSQPRFRMAQRLLRLESQLLSSATFPPYRPLRPRLSLLHARPHARVLHILRRGARRYWRPA